MYGSCLLDRDSFYQVAVDEFGWTPEEEGRYPDAYARYGFDMYFSISTHPNWELRAGTLSSDFPFAEIEYSARVVKRWEFDTDTYPSTEDKKQALRDVLAEHANGTFDWMDKSKEELGIWW